MISSTARSFFDVRRDREAARTASNFCRTQHEIKNDNSGMSTISLSTYRFNGIDVIGETADVTHNVYFGCQTFVETQLVDVTILLAQQVNAFLGRYVFAIQFHL